MAVAKFDRDGRLVTAYGSGGVSVAALDFRTSFLRALAVDAQGNAYLGGEVFGPPASAPRAIVVKLDASGAPARDFGSGGAVLGPECAINLDGMGLALDARGELVVGTCVGFGVGVYKLDARGQLLASFREAGARPGLFGPPVGAADPGFAHVAALAIAANGDIVVAGTRSDPSRCGDFAVALLDARGEPVTSFGNAGVATWHVDNDSATSLALDARNRIYVGGTSVGVCPLRGPSPGVFSVFRLT